MNSISFINKNHDISVEMPEWTRHHTKLALLAMQKIGDQVVYHNSNSEAVIAALKSESDVMIRSEELHRQDEFVKVKSYYIPVYNNNVFNPVKHIRNYNPLKENTHLEYTLKLKFMIGNDKVFINYDFFTDSQNHATVADIIEQRSIHDILVEILEKGAIRDDVGIETDQIDKDGYIIFENIDRSDILIKATDPDGFEIELDMNFDDFLKHLTGIDLVSVNEKEITDLRVFNDDELANIIISEISLDKVKIKPMNTLDYNTYNAVITGYSYYGDRHGLNFEIKDIVHDDYYDSGIFEGDLKYNIAHHLNDDMNIIDPSIKSIDVNVYVEAKWNHHSDRDIDDVIYTIVLLESLDDLLTHLNKVSQ